MSIPDMKDESDIALAAAMLNDMSDMLGRTGFVSPMEENYSEDMEDKGARLEDMGRGCSMLGSRPEGGPRNPMWLGGKKSDGWPGNLPP